MTQTTAIQTKGTATAFAAVLKADSVQAQFRNALGKHSDAFVASLIDLYNGDKSLQECNTNTLICEALKAATLQLPLNKALGFAYIVVYKNSVKQPDGSWVKVPTPTFIPGYKGYIQLAMRTGQYKNINADVVYEGELRKVNKLTGEIQFDGERKSDKVVGYFAYFELLNGFTKTLYMSVEEMASYAKRFSPSLGKDITADKLISIAQQGQIGKGVGWQGDFNAMALKTCVRRLLSKYGYLSIEMQNALSNDNDEASVIERDNAIEQYANSQQLAVDTEFEEVTPPNAIVAPVQQGGAQPSVQMQEANNEPY